MEVSSEQFNCRLYRSWTFASAISILDLQYTSRNEHPSDYVLRESR